MEGTDELISELLIALHTAYGMIPLPVRGEDRVFPNARVFSVRFGFVRPSLESASV
jgi:hypothetical protein